MEKIITLLMLLASLNFFGQEGILKNKEYNSLDEALKNPGMVYKLNLSNQNLNFKILIGLNL